MDVSNVVLPVDDHNSRTHGRLVEVHRLLFPEIRRKDECKLPIFFRKSHHNIDKAKADVPDIMTTLLSPLEGSKPNPDELAMLRGDSQLIVVAGR